MLPCDSKLNQPEAFHVFSQFTAPVKRHLITAETLFYNLLVLLRKFFLLLLRGKLSLLFISKLRNVYRGCAFATDELKC